VRPVFQDPTRRRWHGFLSFAGSGTATLAFLAVVLWVSVSVTPELTPLPELVTATPESTPAAVDAFATELAGLATTDLEPAVVDAVQPSDVLMPVERSALILPKLTPQPAMAPPTPTNAAAPATRQINSASIQTLETLSDTEWVVIPGAAGGSIQEVGR
jgi:hypothetical protein